MEKIYKSNLKELIINSKLNENQKLLWELFLKISNSEEDEAILEAASESDENLNLLTLHLRDKIWDMKENNSKVWHDLTRDEEKYASIL